MGSEIDFVDDKQIRARYSRPAFARYLIACGDVDHIDRQVDQLRAESRREIVAAGFNKN